MPSRGEGQRSSQHEQGEQSSSRDTPQACRLINIVLNKRCVSKRCPFYFPMTPVEADGGMREIRPDGWELGWSGAERSGRPTKEGGFRSVFLGRASFEHLVFSRP